MLSGSQKYERTQLQHLSLNHNRGHLSIGLVCSLNNGANMKWVTEKIWSSDGGHRVPALGAAEGINSSHKGITRGSHLHFTLTTKVETSHARSCLDHHNSYQICFLIFYTAIMENWTSMALSNFPRLWDEEITWPFYDIKLTELSIILLWLEGKTSNVMKVLFHKNLSPLFYKSFRTSWKSEHIITKLLIMNNVANRWLRCQSDSKRER